MYPDKTSADHKAAEKSIDKFAKDIVNEHLMAESIMLMKPH